MSRYIPRAEIPPRGNVISMRLSTFASIWQLPAEEKLRFMDHMMEFMSNDEPDISDMGYASRIYFGDWMDHQGFAAQSAREKQARAKAASAKAVIAKHLKMPPPTR